MALMSVHGLGVPGRLSDASLEPCAGRISLGDQDLARIDSLQRARQIALQPQFIDSVWALTVHDIVSMGRLPWGDSDQSIIRAVMRRCKGSSSRTSSCMSRAVTRMSGSRSSRTG